jgi:hypothetical protein
MLAGGGNEGGERDDDEESGRVSGKSEHLLPPKYFVSYKYMPGFECVSELPRPDKEEMSLTPVRAKIPRAVEKGISDGLGRGWTRQETI